MSDSHIITNGLVRGWALPEAGEGGDKASRGTVLVVGGSVPVPGAVILAGVAALRTGAGRLQVATTRSTAVALGVALPEALMAGLPETTEGGIDPTGAAALGPMVRDASAVLVGPGMVDRHAVVALTALVLEAASQAGPSGPAVVLDAAVLSALHLDDDPFAGLADRVVLTPNEGELATLAGRDPEGLDVAATAEEVARRSGAVVVVRGVVVAPDGERWWHDDGTPALGTSGSGDVKSGIVAGVAARGATPAQAGVWGAHVHARAGERLAVRIGLGFLARELLEEIPAALAEISS